MQNYVDHDFKDEDTIMCKFEVTIPEKANEWKQMKRDPSVWMVKGMRKTEVDYRKLSPEERKGFDVAKEAEVNQWVKEAAARRVSETVSEDRIMRMRWILTYKQSGEPKARLVVIGYEDPDLATLVSASPTMSRRTRQLFYVLAKLKGWQTQKGDVKAAFLQGRKSFAAGSWCLRSCTS